jgi:hypothetical protein
MIRWIASFLAMTNNFVRNDGQSSNSVNPDSDKIKVQGTRYKEQAEIHPLMNNHSNHINHSSDRFSTQITQIKQIFADKKKSAVICINLRHLSAYLNNAFKPNL